MTLTRRVFLVSPLAVYLSRFLPKPQASQTSNSLGVYFISNETTPDHITKIIASGSKVAQCHLVWSRVVRRGWEYYDNILNPLIQAGFQLVLMAGYHPGQVSPRSERNLLTEAGELDAIKLQEFETFLSEAMRRYSGSHVWSWDEEPDFWWDIHRDDRFIGAWGGKPAEFLRVLQTMRGVRDSVNPSAKLLLSPVARENWAPADQRPTFDMDFLANLAGLGGFGLVDIWGCNYYAPGFYPHHGNGPWSIIAKLQKARDTLPAQYRSKPLFVNTGHVVRNATTDFGFDPADYVKQSSAHLWAAPFLHGLNVTAHTHFVWQPKADGDIEWGLTNTDGSLRPAGHAVKWLNDRIPQRPIGARRFVCPGKEGYIFTLSDGNEKLITWTSCADMDNDGIISAGDIQAVADSWHQRGDCLKYDLDGDGVVRVTDIQEVAKRWGEGC